MIDFKNIEYLKQGNKRQQLAFNDLVKLDIFNVLQAFTPVLTGTIPIEIDIDDSDLDIICCCKDLNAFMDVLIKNFSFYPAFRITKKQIRNIETIISKFKSENYTIEIFGQNKPIEKQESYRHMLIEYKILKEKSRDFRKQIIELKKQGYKTEPAFAKLLSLKGNSYFELLKLD
ncbi:DUF4269 domain-containing protein [Bacteroidota bacterium]